MQNVVYNVHVANVLLKMGLYFIGFFSCEVLANTTQWKSCSARCSLAQQYGIARYNVHIII